MCWSGRPLGECCKKTRAPGPRFARALRPEGTCGGGSAGPLEAGLEAWRELNGSLRMHWRFMSGIYSRLFLIKSLRCKRNWRLLSCSWHWPSPGLLRPRCPCFCIATPDRDTLQSSSSAHTQAHPRSALWPPKLGHGQAVAGKTPEVTAASSSRTLPRPPTEPPCSRPVPRRSRAAHGGTCQPHSLLAAQQSPSGQSCPATLLHRR